MEFKVNSADLSSTAHQLHAGSEEIASRLSTMRGQVQLLIDNGWQGAAASSFGNLYHQWATSAQSLRDALDGISRLLSNASVAYATTEQHIINSIHSS